MGRSNRRKQETPEPSSSEESSECKQETSEEESVKMEESSIEEAEPLADTDIRQVAFKQIYEQYWYGMYGTFMIIIDIVTGFINATHICNLATKELGVRKQYTKWSKSKHIRKLMRELAKVLDDDVLSNYVDIKKAQLIRGTYIHRALIPSISSWLLPGLAIALVPLFEEWADKDNNRAKYNQAMCNAVKYKRRTEADVQADLAILIGADREVTCFAGKIDLLTDKVLVEVKCDEHWIKAIGQLIVYSDDYPRHQKILYLYDLRDRCPRESILRVCASNNILVATNHEQLLGHINNIERKQAKTKKSARNI